MEVLYSALEGEIGAFVGHVKRCQQGFDLRRLYHVLLLVLPWSPSGQVESWQHLQRLVQHQPSSASPDVASYVSWLASYLKHLSTLKERFDTMVVVPLCENLYVHEKPASHTTQQSPRLSIPHLATQLFTCRRNWGLLLQGGALSERVFSPRSLLDLCGFAGVEPFEKVLRLVPDVFHQSLAMADLAQQWVRLHRSRYSLSLPPSPSPSLSPSPLPLLSPSLPQQPSAQGRAGLAPSTVQLPLRGKVPQQPSSPLGFPSLLVPPRPSGTGSTRLLQAQLRESREELLALLHRGQRAAVLHAQVHHVAQRICTLRLQQRGKGTELSQPRQRPGMGTGSCWHQAVPAEELQKNLELEEYHHSILEADWLLELEVRPMLIRRIDELQQHCQHLERMLRGQALPTPQQGWLRNRMATNTVPRWAQPSAM